MKYEATMKIVMRSDDKEFIERSINDTKEDAADIAKQTDNKFNIEVTATEIIDTDAPVHTNLGDDNAEQ